LTRFCQKALKEAEQKVQILLEENGEPTLKPFADES
jgi:exodeoxyribonuclease VII small subunit